VAAPKVGNSILVPQPTLQVSGRRPNVHKTMGVFNWLARLARAARSRDSPLRAFAGADYLVHVARAWSDDRGVGIYGWVLSRRAEPAPPEIWVNGEKATIVSWHEWPEVLALHPGLEKGNSTCGFSAYVPKHTSRRPVVQIKTDARSRSARVKYAQEQFRGPSSFSADGGALFQRFVELANREKFRLLELGSRIVCAGSASRRGMFPAAPLFVGFDYYPDQNTDVVGDAHRLSSYFPAGTHFDAIFSLSVLEHLAMPWKVVMEINKLLPVGGYTMHATHLVWPEHEMPWDFWRFTHEGLRALFSPALGFEVVDAGRFDPMRLHPEVVRAETVNLPLERGFGGVAILARKISKVDETRIRWDVPLEAVLTSGSAYPASSVRTTG
jgi:hypothetical protein